MTSLWMVAEIPWLVPWSFAVRGLDRVGRRSLGGVTVTGPSGDPIDPRVARVERVPGVSRRDVARSVARGRGLTRMERPLFRKRIC